MKKKYIRITIEATIEAATMTAFDSASNAEEAIGNYVHAWLSDQAEIESFDTNAEEYEE